MPTLRLLVFIFLAVATAGLAQGTNKLDSLRELAIELTDHPSKINREHLKLFQEYLSSAKEVQSSPDIVLAYQQLAALYYKLGNVNNALHYYKLFTHEYEAFAQEKHNKDQRFMQNLVENEIKALGIKIENLENENNKLKADQTDFLNKNYIIYLGLQVILAIALILIIGWFYNRYKSKKIKISTAPQTPNTNQLAELLESTKNEMDRLEMDLDMSDILAQQLIIQPTKVFADNKSIRKKFLLHLPKKLAGGDGLFLHSAGQKTIIAVYDAPGYGAAGGLLAARINDALNDIVGRSNILSPSLILQKVEQSLMAIFPAGVPFSGGISMAVCLYDTSIRLMSFAGANMDLLNVHRGVVDRVKGQNAALLTNSGQSEYQNLEFEVQKGTNFYLSTDGFWVQTGGHEAKPLGILAFENALTSLYNQPAEEQENVLNRILAKWKGGNQQDDDILVFGFGL